MSSITTDSENTFKVSSKLDSHSDYGPFGGLAKYAKPIIGGFVGVVAVVGIASFVMSRKDENSEKARSALFQASQTLENEKKALASVLAPDATVPVAEEEPADDEEGPAPAAKAAAKEKKPSKKEPAADAISFKKFDVDAKLPESVKKLSAVAADFRGTRAGFEAQMTLGNLYYQHGQPEKSVTWFQRSTETAPNNFDKALALNALAYSYEVAGKSKEAAESFEKAMNLGQPGVKGDALMGMARNYESLHDLTKARSTYDQVISQLPNTDYAKKAEQLKAALQ